MITDIHGKPIDDIWQSEFRGFFYGEGYLAVLTNGRTKNGLHPQYLVRAQIVSRSDDLPILMEIHRRLGGHLMPNENGKKVKANGGKEYQSKPFSVWRASGKTAVTRVCKILDRGMLPAKKRDQTKCVKQMMETMAKTWCQDDKVWKLRECLHIESKRQHAYDEAIALACTKLVRETKQKGG